MIKVICKCGKAMGAKPEQAGKRFKCPNCGEVLTVPANPQPVGVEKSPATPATPEPPQPPPLPGAANLASLFNSMSPQGAAQFAEMLNQSGKARTGSPQWLSRRKGLGTSTRRPLTDDEVAYGTLGCLLPIAAFCVLGVVGMMVSRDAPLPGKIIWSVLSSLLVVLVIRNMRRRWTIGRGIWMAVVAFIIGGAGVDLTGNLIEEKRLAPVLTPMIAEVGDVAKLTHAQGKPKCRGNAIALVLCKKGEKQRTDPITPELEFEFFRALPSDLRVHSTGDEVKTFIVVDWWWNYYGTYRNKITGGLGNAYTGTCNVTVIDRSSHQIIAEQKFISQDTPPASKRTAMEWYGSQPQVEEIVKWLAALPRE